MSSTMHTFQARFCLILSLCVFALIPPSAAPLSADLDPKTGKFSYSGGGGIDPALGQVALYLIALNRQEGRTFISHDVEEGVGGYQLRFFDNGNQLPDAEDWFSVRRYQIPAEPDTLQPPEYYKHIYVEFVDVGLDGIDNSDHYFINGRRFDLAGQPADVLRQYQIHIESGVGALVRKVGYQAILDKIGVLSQADFLKTESHEEGSMPADAVFGIDLRYVFRPFQRKGATLGKEEMAGEIRQQVGFVYSATVGYTDIQGYRFRDIADQSALLQRSYDPVEARILDLILGALFDPDGDGLIAQENIQNGYTRFREIHQQLTETARSGNRRIVLPGEKLARLRQEYETVHKKPFEF